MTELLPRNNITKFLKSETEQKIKFMEYIKCGHCPAGQYCKETSIHDDASCISTFTKWALKED